MIDETKLWNALKKGDHNALQVLYNHFAEMLYSYGMILCRDEDKVKDGIHDLFLSIWNSKDRLSIPQSTKAYLFVSLRHRLFDKGSKMSTLTDHIESTSDLPHLSEGHEEKWIRYEDESEQQGKLDQAMSRLSERQREIIHMKYLQELEYDEIARIMDLNYQSARNLVNRAITALRKEMLLSVMIILMSL